MFRLRKKLRKTKTNAPILFLGSAGVDDVHHARIASSADDLHNGEPFVRVSLCGAVVNRDLCSLSTVDRLISFDNVFDDDFTICRECYGASDGMLTGRRFRR